MDWKVESAIETARGNDCLVIRSEQGRFKYSRIRELTSGETRYRCTNRSCKVNVFIGSGNRVLRASADAVHNHAGLKAGQFALMRLRTACKQYARDNVGSKPIAEIMKDAYNIGAYSIPASKKRLLKKAIHSAKRHVMAHSRRLHPNFTRKLSDSQVSGQTDSAIVIEDDPLEPDPRPLDEPAVSRSDLGKDSKVFALAVSVSQPAGKPCQLPVPALAPLGTLLKPPPGTVPTLRVRREFGSGWRAEPCPLGLKQEVKMEEETDEEEPVFKEEQEDGFPAHFHIDQASQTEMDEDQKFLEKMYFWMKELRPCDKSMVTAQIQQLFMWKLKKKL